MKETHSDGTVVERTRPVHSREVFRWPEYKAFAKRLGIPEKVQTTRLAVHLDCEAVAVVNHEYLGSDSERKAETALLSPS